MNIAEQIRLNPGPNTPGSTGETDDTGRMVWRATTPDPLLTAAAAVLDVLADTCDVAERFTCSEADTIADLFRAAGRDEDAAAFLAAHGEDDDEGDAHYREDPEDAAHRAAGKCAFVSPSGYRCGVDAEDGAYCLTHKHLGAGL